MVIRVEDSFQCAGQGRASIWHRTPGRRPLRLTLIRPVCGENRQIRNSQCLVIWKLLIYMIEINWGGRFGFSPISVAAAVGDLATSGLYGMTEFE